MYIPKIITKEIYNSEVIYSSFIEFVKRAKDKETELGDTFRIHLETDEGGRYFFHSAEEALNEADPENIKTLDNKKISMFSINFGGIFNILFWPKLSCSLKIQLGDLVGTALESIANSCFNFNFKKPLIIRIAESKRFMAFTSLLSTVAVLQLAPEWDLAALAFLSG